MRAFVWMAKRWSAWVWVCFLAFLGIVVLAELVEQGRTLSQGGDWSDLLRGVGDKLPLLVRDLWTPLLALSASLFVCHYRFTALKNLWLSGVRPVGFLLQMGLVSLVWSLLVLGAVEGRLKHQVVDHEQVEWVLVDGLATQLHSDGTGQISVLQIQGVDAGLILSRPQNWEPSIVQALFWGANPAQAALAQLVDHPHPMAGAWRQWRMLSWVLPALLVVGVAWACLVLPFGLGLLSFLSLAMGIGTQMTGSVLAQMGHNSGYPVVFVASGFVILGCWKSLRGGLGP